MEIQIVRDFIPLSELQSVAMHWYGNMVKGVVDIEREILALGGEYHMDANVILVEDGSKQDSVWGFNVHLERPRGEWIEYRSLINIRPRQNNRGMLIEDQALQERMKSIINKRIA